MKNELTAAEFRELLKNGQISTGKKGRLKLTGAPGQAIEQSLGKDSLEPPVKENQGRIKHPNQGRTQSQRQSERYRNEIRIVLNMLRLQFEEEYKFDATGRRKFRFDFCVAELRLGIEFEGIGFSKDGTARKSRHTSVTGYTNDCSKYNLAVSQGWRMLRYTAKNIHEITDDLTALIKLGTHYIHGPDIFNDKIVRIETVPEGQGGAGGGSANPNKTGYPGGMAVHMVIRKKI